MHTRVIACSSASRASLQLVLVRRRDWVADSGAAREAYWQSAPYGLSELICAVGRCVDDDMPSLV